MEAIKGVIYDRGRTEDGKYKALIGVMLVTDEPIKDIQEETVIMGVSQFDHPITHALNDIYKKYAYDWKLGSLDQGLIQASQMDPTELTQIKKGKK